MPRSMRCTQVASWVTEDNEQVLIVVIVYCSPTRWHVYTSSGYPSSPVQTLLEQRGRIRVLRPLPRRPIMKVRTSVKLLCEACYKVKVQLTRDKAYFFVLCNKNPKHKQRTKWARFGTSSHSNEEVHQQHDTCGHPGATHPASQTAWQQHQVAKSSAQHQRLPAGAAMQLPACFSYHSKPGGAALEDFPRPPAQLQWAPLTLLTALHAQPCGTAPVQAHAWNRQALALRLLAVWLPGCMRLWGHARKYAGDQPTHQTSPLPSPRHCVPRAWGEGERDRGCSTSVLLPWQQLLLVTVVRDGTTV
ncbi:uncharacterized protein HaLaN_13358 [Haematococcus lacustris]|uniref:Ribosomal protein n=1 Tax=Haematococcus lacustris TaxID=44745 RepID=A0A699ZC49_HAELA|nr:uncharacterized protein HaLaN_13358 [Haematococcus lacustris]